MRLICAAMTLGVATGASLGQSLLISESGGQGSYGYGYALWANYTPVIDSLFDSVTVVQNLENLDQMLQHDRLWLDQRWTDGSLTQNEVNNIAAYIATGRRVVMVGENDSWTSWNNQILGIVGGTYTGQQFGEATKIMDWPIITEGVNRVTTAAVGTASGGEQLFNFNFVTVWPGAGNNNVTTVLDVNFMDIDRWGLVDNAALATNIAEWLAIPAPSTGAALVLGVLATGRRRR